MLITDLIDNIEAKTLYLLKGEMENWFSEHYMTLEEKIPEHTQYEIGYFENRNDATKVQEKICDDFYISPKSLKIQEIKAYGAKSTPKNTPTTGNRSRGIPTPKPNDTNRKVVLQEAPPSMYNPNPNPNPDPNPNPNPNFERPGVQTRSQTANFTQFSNPSAFIPPQPQPQPQLQSQLYQPQPQSRPPNSFPRKPRSNRAPLPPLNAPMGGFSAQSIVYRDPSQIPEEYGGTYDLEPINVLLGKGCSHDGLQSGTIKTGSSYSRMRSANL